MIIALWLIAALLLLNLAVQVWTTLSSQKISKRAILVKRRLAQEEKNSMTRVVLSVKTLVTTLERLTPEKLPEVAGHIADGVKRLASFSAGTEKIAAANVEAITRLEGAVNEFTRMSLGIDANGNGRRKNFQDLADDNEVDRLVRELNVPRHEAIDQVRQDRMYDFEAR